MCMLMCLCTNMHSSYVYGRHMCMFMCVCEHLCLYVCLHVVMVTCSSHFFIHMWIPVCSHLVHVHI